MVLTRAKMSEYLFDKLGLSRRDIKELIELSFEKIRCILESDEQAKPSGSGNFNLRDRNRCPRCNPKMGGDIPTTVRRAVIFRPGQELEGQVESASPKDE